MEDLNQSLKFLLNMSQVQAVLSRKFDSKLNGLGLSEFIILLHLSQSENEKMRRVDLAEKIGLTPSGVTRLLLPMEKVGLVKKETNEQDARVSYVILASGGKRKLSEAMERAGLFAEEIIPAAKAKTLNEQFKILSDLGASFK